MTQLCLQACGCGVGLQLLFSLLGCRLVNWWLAISLCYRWGGCLVGRNGCNAPKASWSLAIYCSIIGGHFHSFSVVACIFSVTERSGQRCDNLWGCVDVSLQDQTSR